MWPDAERIVLTNIPVSSKAAPLDVVLRHGGLIHGSIAYPVGTRSIGRLWQLRQQIFRLNADVLVYLASPRGRLNAIRDWLFFRWCGLKHIVGLPRTVDLQTCRRTNSSRTSGAGPQEYECERLARCLQSLGTIDLDNPAMWDLRLTDHEKQTGDAALAALEDRRYFAVNMGGKAREKDWGIANWRTLLVRLSRLYQHTGLVIVGAAEDAERAQMVADAWAGPVLDLCGKLSPREAAAAMRHASVFIGHDSGPLHLAAATGVPCVGIFGDFNEPNRWHPRGAQHRIIHRMEGLDTIQVSEVIAAVNEIHPSAEGYRINVRESVSLPPSEYCANAQLR